MTRRIITFDVFIRTRRQDGRWGEWRREQMKERMWQIEEIQSIAREIPECTVEGVFDDSFSPLKAGDEPGLAYFLLKRTA